MLLHSTIAPASPHSRASAGIPQIDSPPPHQRFAPIGATHPRCPSALTARCACALIGAVVRVVHRKSYIVHRQAPPATGRHQPPPSPLSNYARARLSKFHFASAPPNSRASAGTPQIVHRTSYLVHRQTHCQMRLPRLLSKMKLIQRRAYGFRNFQNYRLWVLLECSRLFTEKTLFPQKLGSSQNLR